MVLFTSRVRKTLVGRGAKRKVTPVRRLNAAVREELRENP